MHLLRIKAKMPLNSCEIDTAPTKYSFASNGSEGLWGNISSVPGEKSFRSDHLIIFKCCSILWKRLFVWKARTL